MTRLYRYDDQTSPFIRILFQRILLDRCADEWRALAWELDKRVKA